MLTPFAAALELPVFGRLLEGAERTVVGTPLSALVGGFVVVVARKG